MVAVGIGQTEQNSTNAPAFVAIGQPSSFTLPRLMNFPRPSVSSEDLKGKLVLLDFWSIHCAGCIVAMPKIIQLQKQFDGKVQFIGIGWDSESAARKFFEKEPRLRIPNAIGVWDQLTHRFGVPGAGVYIWIDGQGIVRAATSHRELTVENIRGFLSGRSLSLPVVSGYGPEVGRFDIDSPLLIDGNGAGNADLQYHSMLTGALRGGLSSVLKNPSGFFKGRRIITTNLRVMDLYGVAFGDSGVEHPRDIFPQFRIISDVADPARFQTSDAEHVYCYELIVPEELASQLHQIMRDELDRFFGTIARIEKRKVKALVLTATGKKTVPLGPRTPIPAGFAPPEGNGQLFMPNFFRFTLQQLLELVLKIPVIDETGLQGSLDLGRSYRDLFAKQTDVTFVRNALSKYGIDLQEAERDVEFLVIRDKVQRP